MADDVEVLQELVGELQDEDKVVDLGTCQGCSSIAMAEACRCKIYTVDNFDPENPGYVRPDKETFLENLRRFGLEDRIELIEMDTTEAAAWWRRERLGQVALWMHDASHEEAKVEEDILAWWGVMQNRGLMLFHDYTGDGTQQGVKLAADRVLGEPMAVRSRFGIFEVRR